MKNDVKPDMDYSLLVAFIIFIIYLILTPCFCFGLLAWLLRTMSFQRKWRTGILGLKHIVFFMTLVVNDSMFQEGRRKFCMSSLGKKFGNGRLGLNHASICNPNITWVRRADKIV